MTTPWLTVVMPTYNGASYVKEALESIVVQAEPECEVIVIDDGSTDTTLEIVATFVNRLRLVIIQVKHGGNWIANTNKAMKLARGEYLCWLHQDDIWCSGRLAALKQIVTERPELDLVLHPSRYVDQSGKTVGMLRCPLVRRGGPLGIDELMRPLLVQNFLGSCATLFRKATVVRLGMCDETLWYLGDWDLWLKFAALGRAFYHPVALSSVRLHSLSQTIVRAAEGPAFRIQYEIVLGRHLANWERSNPMQKSISRAARCAAEINIELARLATGTSGNAGRIVWLLLALTPCGLYHFILSSRIIERIVSRLRARVIAWDKRSQVRTE